MRKLQSTARRRGKKRSKREEEQEKSKIIEVLKNKEISKKEIKEREVWDREGESLNKNEKKTKRRKLEESNHSVFTKETTTSQRKKDISIHGSFGKSRIGSIIEMTVFNWMVYSGPVKIINGEGINLVVAANASGKSSLVCAIVFGLGYTSSVLSRGKNLIDYIKKGQTESYIEIILKKNENEKLQIIRKMKVIKNSVESIWMLNDKVVESQEIRKIQKIYNINIDNLIAFLPQENVSKFSGLTPGELFENTLEAVDRKLVETYKNMQIISKEIEKNQSAVDAYKDEERIAKAVIEKLEKQKEELQYYVDLRNSKHVLEIQRDTLLLEKRIKQFDETCREIERLKKKRTQVIDEMKPYHIELNKCEQSLLSVTKELEESTKLKKNITKKYVRFHLNYDEIDTNILNEVESFNNVLNSVKNAEDKINLLLKEQRKLKKEMERIEDCLQKSASVPECIQKEHDSLKKKTEDLKKQLVKLENEYVLYENELQKKEQEIQKNKTLEEVQEMNLLEKVDEKTKQRIIHFKEKIEMIVREHKLIENEKLLEYTHEMKKVVESVNDGNDFIRKLIEELAKQNILYGPLCKYIKSIKCEYNYILEFVLNNAFSNFVLVDSNRKEFLECLYKVYKLPVITAANEKPTFCEVTQEMQSKGVICFLHELFESPDVIKNTLVHIVPIHTLFVVNPNILKEKSTEQIEEFNNFMLREIRKQQKNKLNAISYFCGNAKHTYRISSYNKNIYSDQVQTIPENKKKNRNPKNQQVLVESDFMKIELEQVKKELEKLQIVLNIRKEKIKTLHEQYKNTEDEYNEYSKKYTERRMLETKQKKINMQIELNDKKIKHTLMKEEFIDKERNKIIKNVVNLNREKLDVLKLYLDCLEEETKMGKPIHDLTKKRKIYQNYMNKVKNELIKFKNKEKLINEEIEKYEKEMRNERGQLNYLKESLTLRKNKLTKKQYEELQNIKVLSLEIIEDRIVMLSRLEGGYEMTHTGNQTIELLLKNLEKQKKYLETIKTEYENLLEQITKNEEKINGILSFWSKEIEEYISFLNYNFSKFMNFINPEFDGQIELVKKNDYYEKCELYIKIRFKKDAELQFLKTSHQSGGERSLVTMLFILTIHKITKNGFYVLDELNQGLDSVNERQIFKLLSYISNPDVYKKYFFDTCSIVFKHIKIDLDSIPQFFIFTPQLIKGISFQNMTVHFLFNGYGVLNNVQFLDIFQKKENK